VSTPGRAWTRGSELRRRWRGGAAVAVLVAAVVAVNVTNSSANPNALPTGLDVPLSAESTGVYCTGFTGPSGPAPAVVTYFNLASRPRTLAVTVRTNRGNAEYLHEVIRPMSSVTLSERLFSFRGYYGVQALVDGGGVVGVVRGVGVNVSTVNCASQGRTSWLAAGLTTKANTTTVISLLNPSAAYVVVNVTALTRSGVLAPALYQGLVVPPLSVLAVTLNPEIVGQRSFAAEVSSVQGDVVVGTTIAYTNLPAQTVAVGGTAALAQHFAFPDLPTNNLATSTIALANPTTTSVSVTLRLVLGSSLLAPSSATAIAPFSLTLAPQSIDDVSVSPNSRVPAAGPATVYVRASGAIDAELLTGTSASVLPWYGAPATAATTQVLYSEGRGFSSVRLVNTTGSGALATLSVLGTSGSHVVLVPAHSVVAVPSGDGARASLLIVRSTVPLFVAGAWAGRLSGVRVVDGSGGG
jgi:hypothetical protein